MTTAAGTVREQAKKIIADSRFRESKTENDTVRLWENYREQALLWRAIALLQVPATVLALIAAFVMWSNRETILNVPARPLPGLYAVEEIPDAEYLSVATEFVNLVATYQPKTARKQFNRAAEYLVEPVLSRFQIEMLGRELRAIESTMRSQVLFVDPTVTHLERRDTDVIVTMVGERHKMVAGEILPNTVTQFRITLSTVPRNSLNEFGIVVTNIETTTSEK